MKNFFVVLLVGAFLCFASLASAEKDEAKKKDHIKFKGKVSAVTGAKPVNGRVSGLMVSVVDDAGKTLVFSVTAATRVHDKTDKRPMQNVTIAPGRNVMVKYEIVDDQNKARVIKLLE